MNGRANPAAARRVGAAGPDPPPADVAVCTLTDQALAERLAGRPRLAVVAPMATANLGIEQLLLGALRLPQLRHLVVCGRDSPVFRQGQSLLALAANGCRLDGSIIGATGFRARLPNVRRPVVAEFRRRVAVHDLIGVREPDVIADVAARLPLLDMEPASPAAAADLAAELAASGVRLRPLAAGGHRPPIATFGDFFVVDVDPTRDRIVVRHYRADLTAAHEMTSKSAQALLLGLVREGLVDDPAHAGYLGGELAKAETALRLGMTYRQDHPLARSR